MTKLGINKNVEEVAGSGFVRSLQMQLNLTCCVFSNINPPNIKQESLQNKLFGIDREDVANIFKCMFLINLGPFTSKTSSPEV